MKETLRARLEKEIKAVDYRCEQLKNHIKLYKDNNDFLAAMKCEIKYTQLSMVSQNLKGLLV
mgnify:CR=1